MAERIDHTHPLYVHPSDTPRTVLIPFQLKGSENYGIWRRSMTIALQAKRKLGFVTGVCTKDLVRDEHHEHWETCNALVLYWIMNIVALFLLSDIVYASNAFLVWEDLNERFDKVNQLWSEFDAMVPSTDCGCTKGNENVKHLQQQHLLHFLGGLNDSYDQARRQIFMKTVEPILNQAYALIIEDECQKGTGMKIMPNSIVEGHIKANCYKLAGYPPNYKGKKKDGIIVNNSFLGDQHPMRSLDQFSYHGNNFHPQPTGIVTSFHASSMPDRWIIDTCVTNHMPSDLRLLYETYKQQGQHVHLPDGRPSYWEGEGDW
ncbi:hypothetical protein KY285_021323 [Solanum tuberosum]|nr:hypothetical protein KY285_021323 [Solanum tuberosum]